MALLQRSNGYGLAVYSDEMEAWAEGIRLQYVLDSWRVRCTGQKALYQQKYVDQCECTLLQVEVHPFVYSFTKDDHN